MLRLPRNLQAISKALRLSRKTGPQPRARPHPVPLDTCQMLPLPRNTHNGIQEMLRLPRNLQAISRACHVLNLREYILLG